MKKKHVLLLLVLVFCFSLCSCGNSSTSSEETSNVEEVKEEEETTEPVVESIDFTLDAGNVKYVGIEKADSELVMDEKNVYLVKFDYTNNQSAPAQVHTTFTLDFFQNGVELYDNLGWSSAGDENQFKLVDGYFSDVMNGGTLTFAKLVQLEDESPLTIMVKENGGDPNNYQMMEVKINSTDETKSNEESEKAPAEETTVEETVKDDSVKKIKKGDKIETEDFEFTLKKVELTYDVEPSDTSGFFMHYEAEDGMVYINVVGEYYNKSKKDVCIRDLFVPSADYDSGFTYDGFVVVEEGGNDFTWVSSYIVCEPLATCKYHGLIECPEVVEESDAPLYITFDVDGTTYRYDIRK